MALSTPYQTLLTFNQDEFTTNELLSVITAVDDIEISLNGFQSLVSKYTRKENRSYLIYVIDSIKDELAEHPKELRDHHETYCSSILGKNFDEIMTTTRSKDLYRAGEELRACLAAYDKHYKELKKAVSTSEL